MTRLEHARFHPSDGRGLVVIADYDYGDVEVERSIIEAGGLSLLALQCKSEQELVDAGKEAMAVITQYATVASASIAGLPKLRHIARYGVGTDIVDVAAADAAGIVVTNVPAEYCREEVAQHAIAMVLYFARRLADYGAGTRDGVWRWQVGAPIHRLSSQRLGVVGLGAIGRTVADYARSLELGVVAYDPFVSAQAAGIAGVELVTFGELLATSDYVVVQAPLTPATAGLFDTEVIGRMKPGAVLVNTSRGPIVDSNALYEALESGHLRGAALDDLPEEPAKLRTWVPTNPLLKLTNCLITPHAAYYSEESIRFCRTFAAEEVVRVATGVEPRSRVRPLPRQLDVKEGAK